MTRWLVVGAGAAGCVVAARLSDDPANEVVLLEAGPDHGVRADPRDVGPFFGDPARVRTDAVVIRRPGAAPVPYEQGVGLGGSSLINGATVVATDEIDATRIELPLELPWALGGLGRAVLDADPDAGRLLLTRRGGRRVTAADAYLRPCLDRMNLLVVTGAAVRRVRFEGRRVTGIETDDGVEYTADRVVICAGAIHTPALLLRSGVDTPGIGDGLHDQPAFAVSLELAPAAIDATAPTIAVAIERPGRRILAVNHVPNDPGLGVLLGGLTEATSTGRVSLPDLAGPPRVELNQLATDHDLNALTAVAMETIALLERPSVRAVVVRAYIDDRGTPVETIAGAPGAIRAWLPEHLTGFHHVSSSCRLGLVTDDTGHVLGYEGVYVCDASLLPVARRPNPYLAVIALAERMVRRWPAG